MSALNDLPGKNRALIANKWLDESSFSGFHFLLFFLGLLIVTCDGYDMFVFGAAVPLLMKDMHISTAQAGVLASLSPIGNLIGSLVFGPIADRFGRKNTVIFTALLFDTAIGLTGLSTNPATFAILRILTGLGVGGSLPNVIALAAEYLPRNNRSIAIAGLMSGIQVGGIAAALLGLWAFPRYGWRPVFLVGAIPILLVPIYAKYLPESSTYLARQNRLDILRTYMHKARPNHMVPDKAFLEVEQGNGAAPLAAIFEEHRAFSTVMFWLIYFMNLYVIFGFTIWLPRLIMSQGYSLARGLSFLLPLSIGSIVGSFLAGHTADRIGSRPALAGCYLVSFCSVASAAYTSDFWYLMALITLAGAGFNGAQNAVNAYIAPYYPPSMRSTGVGMCYGMGRLGAIFGPVLIGALMSMHFSYRATVVSIALPAIIPAIAILTVQERYGFGSTLIMQKNGFGAPHYDGRAPQ
jgi:AAHS family benzoate transporter-like MFS transporter